MHYYKIWNRFKKDIKNHWNLKSICSIAFMSNFFPHEPYFLEWKIGNTFVCRGTEEKVYLKLTIACAILEKSVQFSKSKEFKGTFWHRQFSAEVIIFSVQNFVVIIIIIAIIIIIIIIIVIIIISLLLFRNKIDTALVGNCLCSL